MILDMTQSETRNEALRQRLSAFRDQLAADGYTCELVGGNKILNSAEGKFGEFMQFTLFVAIAKVGKAARTHSSSPTDNDKV